jgi:glycosyltransferase involved in cell wall biosynthesis
MISQPLARVDLHLHSRASNVTDYYAANAFSIPESYSDPHQLYRALKARGMSLVTLTDHNAIEGALELLNAGHDDVFISAEMTTTFPEDGCNIHITVANMTESQFAEINRLRGNVYEMLAYVDHEIAVEHLVPGRNRLAYFMTHPLMSTQNRPYGREGALSVEHLEKAMLLCNCLEVQNGARTRALNTLTLRMLNALTPERIEHLANKHDLAPKGDTPWLKAVVGGSDDHSGINPGGTWTTFPVGNRPITANALVDAIRARATAPAGAHGGPVTIAHSIIKLLYQGGQRGGAAKNVALSGPLQGLLAQVFDGEAQPWHRRQRFRFNVWWHAQPWAKARVNRPCTFEQALRREIYGLLADTGFRGELAAAADTDARIFLVIKTLLNRIFIHYLEHLKAPQRGDLIGTIKEAVALATSNLFVSLPYLVAFLQQSADAQIARDVRRAFDIVEPGRVVLLTDTLFEVNGVANSIKRMIREAIRRNLAFTVLTAVEPHRMAQHLADPEVHAWVQGGYLKLFPAIASLDFPQYDGLAIRFPPVLDVLKYLQESGCTKLQLSTPGTLGLTGLLAAKLLQIECAATYHTSFPEYVENYTRDVSLEAMTWKYMILFYHAVDEVLVPSQYVAKLLHRRGLRNRKLLILDRWVDVERFHPKHRVEGYWRKHGLAHAQARVKFVYVGRVAVEKNLHVLAAAFRRLTAAGQAAHLIVIGDGPYRAQLATLLDGQPVTFTGYLQGPDLATAIASADVKVFPSTTDTWGNAPLEAQASGLPVVVTDIGGPAELMQDGITGIRVKGGDTDSLLAAMEALMDFRLRERMGRAARHFAEVNRVDMPFSAVLESDAYRRRLKDQRRTAATAVPAHLRAVAA